MTSAPSSRDGSPSATDIGGAEAPDAECWIGKTPSGSVGRIIRRGRPSVAEAQLLPDQILDAGWKLLLECGFEAFNFDRLARQARVGKATIYSRFANKRALLVALVEYYLENRRAQFQNRPRDLPIVEGFATQAAEILNSLFSADGILFERLVDWLDQEGAADGTGIRGQSYAQVAATIESSLQEVVNRGETTITDVSRAARFWLEAMIGHARMAGSQGRKSPAENAQWARDYTEFFFRKIS